MMYSNDQIMQLLDDHVTALHPSDTLEAWDEFDKYLTRKNEVKLPETPDSADDIKRLTMRVNYPKTIINATINMILGEGLTVVDKDGKENVALARRVDRYQQRKLIRYMSTYGGAWLHALPNDPQLPFRVYKPHVAKRIAAREDAALDKAVLVIETFETIAEREKPAQEYHVARWYEYEESEDGKRNGRVRRLVFSDETGTWKEREKQRDTFTYMPFIWVPNREVDSDALHEASDIVDGIPIFKGIDELVTKLNKALEDEAFRFTFFANVDDRQMKNMVNQGASSIWYAKNETGEGPEPKMYTGLPTDLKQFLEVFRQYAKFISTTTRTSPLELDERPVQDIPAETLRVLYGPQLARCTETAEYASNALALLLARIAPNEFSLEPDSKARVAFNVVMPVSETTRYQQDKALFDSNAIDTIEILKKRGYTEEEASAIRDRTEAEMRRRAEIENAVLLEVEKIKASNQTENNIETSR